MRRTPAASAALLALVGTALLAAGDEAPKLDYRFDEVKSKVLVASAATPDAEKRVSAGDTASAGDHVRTGFWGSAVVTVPSKKARFEIGPSTRAVLAGGEPGVLVTLEKGRLKSVFEALTGGPPEERRVAAPGALLAVRGTRYGLDVGDGGETFLAVFEGVVEVIPRHPSFPPVSVRADEFCTFGPKAPPQPAPMRERGMSEGSWGPRAMRAEPGRGPDGRPAEGAAPGMPGAGPGAGGPGGGSPMPGAPPAGPKK